MWKRRSRWAYPLLLLLLNPFILTEGRALCRVMYRTLTTT